MKLSAATLNFITAASTLAMTSASGMSFMERRTQEDCPGDCPIDCDALTECNWPGYNPAYLGDGYCDDNNGCYNHKICGFDGGDCCTGTCPPGLTVPGNQFECGSGGYDCKVKENCAKKEIRIAHFCNFGADPLFTMSPDDAEEIEVKFVLQNNPEYYPRADTRTCGPAYGDENTYAAERLGAPGARSWYCRMPVDSCLATADAQFIDPAPLYTIKVGVDETDNTDMAQMVSTGLSPGDWFANDCQDYQVNLYVPYDRTQKPIACTITDGGYELEGTQSKSCLSIDTPFQDTYLIIFDVRSQL